MSRFGKTLRLTFVLVAVAAAVVWGVRHDNALAECAAKGGTLYPDGCFKVVRVPV